MIKKQKGADDFYKIFEKNDRSMSEVDKTKFLSLLKEIFATYEKPLIPIREHATLYGKISSRIYFFGVLGCAIFSVFFSVMSLWFQSSQSISFLFLFFFYFCFFSYNFYYTLSYQSEIDFSIFTIEPYFSKLKSFSDIYSPKLMELSEESIEIGLLALKENYYTLSRILPNAINLFRSTISLSGMIASIFILFEISLKPWIIFIAYGNMIILFLIVFKLGRLSRLNLLTIYDYIIPMAEAALRLKSGKNR